MENTDLADVRLLKRGEVVVTDGVNEGSHGEFDTRKISLDGFG